MYYILTPYLYRAKENWTLLKYLKLSKKILPCKNILQPHITTVAIINTNLKNLFQRLYPEFLEFCLCLLQP